MTRKLSRRVWMKTLGSFTAVSGLSKAASSSPQSSQVTPLPHSPLSPRGTQHVLPQKVLLWERTRKEVREALARGDLKAAIVPTGSTEQHNEHLALICDAAVATLMAQQTALRLYPQAIVSTPVPVGYAPYHMARKGTLTVRKETFLSYVFDVIESLSAHGIETIMVVNGHGGNHRLLKDALPGWRRNLGITLDADSYSAGFENQNLSEFLDSYRALEEGKLDTIARRTAHSHASENETSIVMAAYPDRVRPFTLKAYDDAQLNYESGLSPKVWKYLEPFGKEGWPKGKNPENARDRARQEQALLATPEKGEKLISLASNFLAEKLQAMIDATEKGTAWPADD